MPRPPAPKKPNNLWFVLGRETKLAAAEVSSFLNLKNFQLQSGVFSTDCSPALPAGELINNLGGTVKIGEEIAANISLKQLKEKIIKQLTNKEGKITFGISFYGDIWPYPIKQLGLEIKNELKKQGCSARYVFKGEPALSSVTVKANKLIDKGGEFLIISSDSNNFSLARTLAVQPFEQFSARDYGRPGRDDLSGMLPPKLAMMIVNLAQAPKDGVILDPFCGSGTILTEAMLLGYKNLIGSDISEKAIEDTKQNLEWTKKVTSSKYQVAGVNLIQSDIKNINQKLKHNSIDAITTEPYLGRPLRGRESKEELTRQAEELKKLYIEAFKQFHLLLKPGGVAVIIIPRFKFRNDWVRIDILEQIKKTGFSPTPLFEDNLFLTYARPDQRVGREVWRFVK